MVAKKVEALLAPVALLIAAAVLLTGLAAFGLWDPWEIDVAERARSRASIEGPPLAELLLRKSLRGLDFAEWAGRLPAAIAGVATVVFVLLLGRRSGGAKIGAYSAIVASTTPLLLFNSRTMIGHAVPMAAQAGLALSLFAAVFPGRAAAHRSQEDHRRTTLEVSGHLILASGFTVASVASAGLMVGVLPPLVAVASLAALDGRFVRRPRDARDIAAIVCAISGLVATLGSALVFYWDGAGYSPITGGAPEGRTPASFEAVIEVVMHGFAPWSALLLIGVAHALEPRVEVDGPGAASTLEGARHRLALFAVLWIAGGYVTTALYDARFGDAPFLPVAALALVVGSVLGSVEESQVSWRMAAVATALLTGLLLRDFMIYPERPLAVLAVSGLTVSDALPTKLPFALTFGAFAVATIASLGVTPASAPLALGAPYRLLADQWRRSRGHRAWLIVGAGLLLFCVAFGGLCFFAGDSLPIGTRALRLGKVLVVIPLALPLAAATLQLFHYLARRLGPLRLAPLLIAGIATGIYFGHAYLPQLGEHYSSREVFGAWNELRASDESLAIHGLQARSGAYYAEGEVIRASNTEALVRHLAEPGRRWALFARADLGRVNSRFRAATGNHLVVLGASTPRVVLVSSEPIDGQRNRNPLTSAVRSALPERIKRPLDIRFGEHVELAGYDITLPHGDYVGPGQTVIVTWYFRVLGSVPGNYEVFVHVDGPGGRINGDHAPAGGSYPTTLWQRDDVVYDRHEIAIPAHVTEGEYAIYVGLWSGPNRLPVSTGEHDGENRAVAGTLRIR